MPCVLVWLPSLFTTGEPLFRPRSTQDETKTSVRCFKMQMLPRLKLGSGGTADPTPTPPHPREAETKGILPSTSNVTGNIRKQKKNIKVTEERHKSTTAGACLAGNPLYS